MMVSAELPVATRAFFFGIRRASRRYFAPRNDWVRPALIDTSPRAALREGLPRPVALLPLRFPADCLTWGDHRAQETRWAAVGKTVMSVPVSAMMSWAQTVPMPSMASSWAIWGSQGSASVSIVAGVAPVWGV